MGLYNIVNQASLQAGQPEDVTQVLANLQAIQTILNGNIEDVNVKAAAAIAYTKLALAASIVNADIAAAAAIAPTKLAAAPRARVYKSVDQSIVNATQSSITFDNEQADNDAIHDNVTNNTRLTAKTAGLYLVKGTVVWAANSTGQRIAQISLNGTTYYEETRQGVTATASQAVQQVVAIIPFAVNDYVQLVVYQDTGGALNITALDGFNSVYTSFEMIRIST